MNVDDISRARIEEAVFTSPGFQSLKQKRCISLQQEEEIVKIIELVNYMLLNEQQNVQQYEI